MFRSFPVIFLVTFLLAAVFGLLAIAQIKAGEEKPGKQKIVIGIVGDMSDSYLGFGIYALENMDSSRYTIHFASLSEEEAKDQIQNGQISVYLKIPDGFVDSIIDGENCPITLVSGGSQGGIGTELIREMAETVSGIVTESQTGIYTQHDIYLKYDLREKLTDAETKLNLTYFKRIFDRESMYELHTLEGDNGLSLPAHYLCAALMIFLLIWGMNGGSLLIKKDMALGKLFFAGGMRCRVQTLCEYLVYLCLLSANFIGIALVLALGTSRIHIPVEEIPGAGEILRLAVGIWPVLVCTAAIQFFLYTLVDSLIGGLLLNFLCALVMGYLSGCFYPLNYLPEAIQRASVCLPARAGMEYLASLLNRQPIGADMCSLLGFSSLFFVGAVLVKKYKMER